MLSTLLFYRLCVLTTICLLIHVVLPQYMDKAVIINLELTIQTQSKLNNDISEDDIQDVIDAAFITTNDDTLFGIPNIDTIQTHTSYGYFSAYDSYEYASIFYVYFTTEEAYDHAVLTGYPIRVDNDLITFITTLESNIKTTLPSMINTTDPSNIEAVEIDSIRIVNLNTGAYTGEVMIRFNGESTTTLPPTKITLNPTGLSPTSSPSIKPTANPVSTVTIIQQSASSNTYSLKSEALYWVIAVVFLFVGCGVGCCCWGLLWVKTDISKYFQGKRPNPNATKRQRPKKDRSVEMQRKKKKKKQEPRSNALDETKRNDEAEELRKKRERYIEYGSDDDSDKADKIFSGPPERIENVTSKSPDPQEEDEVSTSEDIKQMRKVSYSSASSLSDHLDKRPETRTVNKKSGKKEPIRYDDHGKRQLTTKELMAQYKKNRQKGGDSVDLSYKVGGLKKKEDELESKEDESYQYDVEDLEDVNHPHYKAPRKRKVRSMKRDDRKKKKKKKQHQRANTGGLDSIAQRQKGKHRRPKSARFGVEYEDKQKKNRPQTARPAGKKRKRKRTNSEEEEDGESYHHRGRRKGSKGSRKGSRARKASRGSRKGSKGRHRTPRSEDDYEYEDEGGDMSSSGQSY